MLYILVGLAFFLGAGLVLGSYFGVTQVPGMMLQRKLEARLEEVAMGPDPEPSGDSGGSTNILRASEGGPMPALERYIGTTTRGTAFGRWLEQTGVKTTISGILLIAAAHAFVFGLIGLWLMKIAFGFVIGAIVGFAMPFMFLKSKRTRRMRAFEEAFPEALDLIARALKAGHAFITGLKMVADEMPDPVGPEFRKAFDEQNFGLPLKDALENMTARVPNLDVRFFATAVLIQRETGGNLSEILENLAHVVRERFKILRQVRVYTAHGRLTGYVLLALPAVLCIALAFINPDHMNTLFREPLGQMLLMVALTLQFIGYMWIRQVVKIEV